MLAENYVSNALLMNVFEVYYWESDGKAEVDFVCQTSDGQCIPIEVKLADNVCSKSLTQFVMKYNPPFSMRVSSENFGLENGIKSVPLYACFCIDKGGCE